MTKAQAKKATAGQYVTDYRRRLLKVVEVVGGGESFRVEVVGDYHTGVQECRRTGIQTSDPTYWDAHTLAYQNAKIVTAVKFID